MKNASNYNRIDLTFDQYFKKVSRKGEDLVGVKVHSTYLKGLY